MKHAKDSRLQRQFHARHYLLFAAVFIISLLGSYFLFSIGEVKAPSQPVSQSQTVAKQAPTLSNSVVIAGLANPWDIAFLPDSSAMLITERKGSVSLVKNGQKTELFTPDDVVARGEGGMLGLAVDPEFATNHSIYTCFNSDKSGSLDIRVVRWEIKPDGSGLVSRTGDIVTGMPANPSGRHSGCRIGFGPDNNLWIGTGDAANNNNPQNLQSLGGKILRVDRDGKGVAGNLGGAADPRIYSYGHRNTQGLAFYDAVKNGSYGVSAEHGSDRDDEVNPLASGNFGWAPGAGYDESVPMTDLNRFPDAVKSIWSSGNPTIATGDAGFLGGSQWGSWEGRLAVAVLKDKYLMILEIKSGEILGEQSKLLDNEFGRLRAVTLGSDGALYISTDNGSDDKIIKLTASAE